MLFVMPRRLTEMPAPCLWAGSSVLRSGARGPDESTAVPSPTWEADRSHTAKGPSSALSQVALWTGLCGSCSGGFSGQSGWVTSGARRGQQLDTVNLLCAGLCCGCKLSVKATNPSQPPQLCFLESSVPGLEWGTWLGHHG